MPRLSGFKNALNHLRPLFKTHGFLSILADGQNIFIGTTEEVTSAARVRELKMFVLMFMQLLQIISF